MVIGVAYEAMAGRNKVLNVYKHRSIETASPAELVLMLYNQALRNMKETHVCLEQNDLQEANRLLQRTQAIVDELRASLDMSFGGKIAEGLDTVYEYVNSRLLEANVRKDGSLVELAAKVLTELRDGWEEAMSSNVS